MKYIENIKVKLPFITILEIAAYSIVILWVGYLSQQSILNNKNLFTMINIETFSLIYGLFYYFISSFPIREIISVRATEKFINKNYPDLYQKFEEEVTQEEKDLLEEIVITCRKVSFSKIERIHIISKIFVSVGFGLLIGRLLFM